MADKESSGGYDWRLRFLIGWIVQDDGDSAAFLEDVTRGAFEKCRNRQERLPDASFSLDAVEYLNRAAKRLTRRLFAQPVALLADRPSWNVPVPYPLCGKSMSLFISWDGARTHLSQELEIGVDVDPEADFRLAAIDGPGGKRIEVRLFPHRTLDSRQRTFLRKVDEVIIEEVDQGIQKFRQEQASAVRELNELLVSRERGISAVEARLMLKKLVAQTGVENFVRWLLADEQKFLEAQPDLFPPRIVADETARLQELTPEAARKAKSRAFQAIQRAAAELMSGRPAGSERSQGRAAGSWK